jgi:hypothetical protein
LSILGESLFTRAYTREMFAQHLLARWPHNSADALHALLLDLGYMQAETDMGSE